MEIYLAKKNTNGNILSIDDHLLDTAAIARQLDAHFCPDLMVKATGLSREDFSALFCFLAAIHDLGKATPAFQKKINGEDIEFRHALAGASILSSYFNVSDSICEIIASHHGKPRSLSRDDSFDRYFKKNTKKLGNDVETWTKLYNQAVVLAGPSFNITSVISIQAQMVLSGLLIIADWIASNEMFFPLINERKLLSDEDRIKRNKIGWEKIALPDCWDPCVPYLDSDIFSTRFGFLPNELQESVVSIVNSISTPGIMIIEAPMGVGKTEAGLAAAEIVSSRVKAGGVFFGLPTKGTANGMFPRMLKWAESVSDNMAVSLRLAHSDASNNNSYRLLQAKTYEEQGVSVNSWLSGRHRALLSDFVIGTVDQFLLAGLLQKYIMLLHAGLSGKTIIIDEVHAYDAYMSSYMESVLSWMGVFQVPVILLSATLTNKKRNDLVKSYTGQDYYENSNDYPCITWSDSNKIQTKALNVNLPKKQITIKYIDDDLLKDSIRNQTDACVGIILNSVNRAQKLYDSLRETFAERKVILIHSRFIPKDRSRLEGLVVNTIGKSSTSLDRNGTIVVGTQVLEQSLDIDFDVLYVDKCPIDLLFQRIGRLHRHFRTDRAIMKPICYIIEGEKTDQIAKYEYTDFLINQTINLIGEKQLDIPLDIKPMTEAVYNTENVMESPEKEAFLTRIKEMRSNAQSFCIPSPDNARMRGLLEIDANGQESVRYGNFGLEVLLWKHNKDGSFETFDGECSFHGFPLPNDIESLLKQRITLPQRFLGELDAIKEMQKELPSWTKLDILKYHLIVLTDEEGICQIGKYKCSYSNNYGLKEVNVV